MLDFTSRWIACEFEATKHISSISCFSVLMKIAIDLSQKSAASTMDGLLAVRALLLKQDPFVISVK